MRDFYKPEPGGDDMDSQDEADWEVTAEGGDDLPRFYSEDSEDSMNDLTTDNDQEWSPSGDDFDFSDDSQEEDEASGSRNPGTSSQNKETSAGGSALNENEEEEEDETVRAIIETIKNSQPSHPPEIKLDDFVVDLSFHPEKDLVALASITGDVLLYEYTNNENKLLKTLEVHTKACRDVEWSDDGTCILTASKDKSIMITDIETEKLKNFYEEAHNSSIYKLYVIDENLFSTGDDCGTVKLWDVRTKDPIFSLKEVEDFISAMLTNDAKKLLLVTSGDGYLTSINIGARKMYVQSEPYEEELTSMGLFRNNSKLVVGTSKGRLYTFNWGEFGYHCDMFPGIKSSIGNMLPLTDRIACVGGEEGIIRAAHIAPFRNLGVVGQHNLPVESMDINHSGEIIASSSHNNDVRFWNIKYFEDFGDIKYNEKHTYKDRTHNLPSSKYSNPSDFFADLANNDSE